MRRKKYIRIETNSYSNPDGNYQVEITRHRRTFDMRSRKYEASEARANQIADLVGTDNFTVELDGGGIVLYGAYAS